MRAACACAGLLSAAVWAVSGCGGGARTGPPVLVVGHVGHDHQIALGVAALAPELTRVAAGVHLEELSRGEAYRLMEGDALRAELRVKKVGGGSNMPKAMAEGVIDIGLGGIPAAIFFIDRGSDIKIICPLNVGGDMLVVGADLPAASWAEFVALVKASPRTVKIGYKDPAAVAKLVFEESCAVEGLHCAAAGTGQAGEIELVNLRGEANALPTLASGAVHGVVINEPVGSLIAHKGAGRVIASLSDVPPHDVGKAHPCCCVCARGDVIARHPEALRAFVRLIRAATDAINADKAAAAELAHRWTKMDLEIEKLSIPNIVYTARFDDDYRRGIERWHALMAPSGAFTGRLKDLSAADLFARVHDVRFMDQGD